METFRPRLMSSYSSSACIVICLLCVASLTSSHIMIEQRSPDLVEPTASESQADQPTLESPNIQYNHVSSPSRPIHSSSQETPAATGVQTEQNYPMQQQCTWDILTSSLTDEQMLKKALDIYLTRNGEERLRETISRNTGLMFRTRIPASMNSVLTPDHEYERIRATLNKISAFQSVTERSEADEKVSSERDGGHFKEMIEPGRGHVLHIEVPANLRSLENSVMSGEIAKGETPFVLFDHSSSDQEADGREEDVSTAPERFLIIPGRRQRPFGTRVRVMVRNKVREVRITSSPRMSVLDALKQAEKKIQYMHPELAGRRVIHLERRLTQTKDGIRDCSSVSKVGRVENDESGQWTIRVSYSPGVQVVYEGSCVPTEREVNVRPATTVDLIFTPFSPEGQQHSSESSSS